MTNMWNQRSARKLVQTRESRMFVFVVFSWILFFGLFLRESQQVWVESSCQTSVVFCCLLSVLCFCRLCLMFDFSVMFGFIYYSLGSGRRHPYFLKSQEFHRVHFLALHFLICCLTDFKQILLAYVHDWNTWKIEKRNVWLNKNRLKFYIIKIWMEKNDFFFQTQRQNLLLFLDDSPIKKQKNNDLKAF